MSKSILEHVPPGASVEQRRELYAARVKKVEEYINAKGVSAKVAMEKVFPDKTVGEYYRWVKGAKGISMHSIKKARKAVKFDTSVCPPVVIEHDVEIPAASRPSPRPGYKKPPAQRLAIVIGSPEELAAFYKTLGV